MNQSSDAVPPARQEPGGPPPRLLGPRFVSMLVLTFFAFGIDNILRPVVPLMVVGRGGDAGIVGLVAAAYALPSVLFRPLIGSLVDAGRHRQVLRQGALVAFAAPFGLLLPGVLALAVVRFVQGIAFSLYSVSTRTSMARLAPPSQRGKASGYYAAMPALGALIGPALGTTLFLLTGDIGPVLIAAGFGLVGIVLTYRSRLTTMDDASPPPRLDLSLRGLLRFVERSSVPATLMLACFQGTQVFFTTFPPVYVLATGEPIEYLVLYYPYVGLLWVVSQVIAGPVADKLGRGRTIRLGSCIAIAGMLVPILWEGLLPFAVAATGYMVGFSLVSPAMSALAIDKAPAARLGSAMATYSMGHGLAAATSSVAFGLIIAAQGFPLAFVGAIGLQLVTIAMSVRFARPAIPEGRAGP